jgi:hypothetical protein
MLSQLNPVTMQEVVSVTKDIANDISKSMKRYKEFYNFLQTLVDQDLLDMGFTQVSVNYIRSFGVALLNMDEAYNNQTKTGNSSPIYFIEILKSMITI